MLITTAAGGFTIQEQFLVSVISSVTTASSWWATALQPSIVSAPLAKHFLQDHLLRVCP